MPLLKKFSKFDKKLWAKLFAVTFLFFLFFVPHSYAASGVPAILSYQGRLTDSGGNLLGSSGTIYYFKFSIWDNSNISSGTRVWPAPAVTLLSFPTVVRQGVFNASIGDTDPSYGYPHALDYDFSTNKDIYLQVEVSADNATFETLSPRIRISSATFAQVSGAVSGIGPSSLGTTTPFANSVLSIEATSTSAIPLFIKAALGQVANLFQIQDSFGSNLFVVNNIGYTGIGTSTPSRKLHVSDPNSTPQLRLSQSDSEYGEFYSDSVGDVRISSTGGNIRQNDENLWVCSGGGCNVDTPADKGNMIVENAVIFDNKFKLKQVDASTTIMYDTENNPIFEFDEGQ